jgi:EAL domain-containing protein (putative c-di-GMP-specific phosphodiesterase class I)
VAEYSEVDSGLSSSNKRFGLRKPGTPRLTELVIRQLLDDGLLRFETQPIIEFATSKVIAHEMFVRVDEFGAPSPIELLHAAQRYGLRDELEARAIEMIRQLHPQRPPNSLTSLNLSWSECGSAKVRQALEGDLDDVIIELGGNSPTPESLPGFVEYLADLRDHGARVAVDWVGGGVPALDLLDQLRPDFVKIKQSLTSRVVGSDAASHDIAMIVRYASSIGAFSLAEGIECGEELSALIRLGVDLGQGWFIGRPEQDNPDLSEPLLTSIRAQVEVSSHEGVVASLVRPTDFVLPGDFPHGALEGRALVATDMKGRASCLWIRDKVDQAGWIVRPVSLRVSGRDDLSTVARRILEREETYRYDPLVCEGPTGLVSGLIYPDEVFAYLAGRDDGRVARMLGFRNNVVRLRHDS